MLHDIGKTFISNEILNKKGPLTEKEYEKIKKHPYTGYKLLKRTSELQEIVDYILYHHERFDGLGYLNKLKGYEIPLISRIISVADAYEAMTSGRAYRSKYSKEYAMNEIIKCSGTQFDPIVVEYLLKVYKEKII
ncbi:hypothetical protein HLPR_03360 [Helicovermis profundi]|uniref:HD-GYP domain-containing protein n=1 Tax=Helicovermis profundi TaxID=3065157 RepID=A0AAU9E298_9FIRM|nr:hypothetical protein HLPR_03360 [Clostridia bacterium S502]